MAGQYMIFVRNKDLQIKQAVDAFIRLEFIMRYNKLGSWRLELYRSDPAAQAFIDAFGEKDGSNNPINKGRTGILIYRNGSLLFSGPVRFMEEHWNKDGHRLVVGGPDDLTWLAERISIVPPYNYNTSYSSQYWYANGSAEYCLKQAVIAQIGSSASVDRQLSGLTVATNLDRGYATVSSRSRFGNTLKEMQRVADFSEFKGSPIGFYLKQSGSGFLFDCYIPQNKTASIIFSPDLGNVLEYEYIQEAPQANLVMAGNGATGVSRQFSYAGDDPSRGLYGTIEGFVDAGSAQNTQELVDEVYKNLEQNAERNELRFIPIEIDGMRFQTNWNLGDKVTFRIGSNVVQDLIREITVTLTPQGGEEIRPIVGDGTAGQRFRLFDRVYNMEYRLTNRETY